jgi:hypothetical protein
MRLKVANEPNLYRDTTSKAIINADTNLYHKYMERRRNQQAKSDEIAQLKEEVGELKLLLQSLLHRIDLGK